MTSQPFKEKENLPCTYVVFAFLSTPSYHSALDLLSGKWGDKEVCIGTYVCVMFIFYSLCESKLKLTR